ncbi:MAG: outer membrane protein OmpA-like peptidoglycan-associated protein [Gammaproteobacteria bacterium]|jgi:outer membrane protein OmpA-like peptidoglycan-associated protein
MIKYTFLIFSSLCLFNIAVYANPLTSRNTAANHKEETGLGIGAIIGGLIAGPPGAIIGAAGGAWFGNKEKREDIKLSDLERRLIEKQGELASLESEFQQMQGRFGNQLHKVKMEKRRGALEDLSRGVSLTVYFRTNSAELDAEIIPRINKLANFIKDFPEIQVQVDAHADRRGDQKYNLALSKQRAQTISQELLKTGLDSNRVHSHAYGESEALSALGDVEGYVFDRRVNIQLTLDTEI